MMKLKMKLCLAMVLASLFWMVVPDGSWAQVPELRILSPRTERSRDTARRGLLSAEFSAQADAAGLYEFDIIGIEPGANAERSSAYGINNLGEVVGKIYNYNADTDAAEDEQAFKWSSRTGVQLLPTLAGGALAWSINDSGMASGYSENAAGHQRAVRWNNATDLPIDIGTLTNATTGTSGDASRAYKLNNQGAVVGNADIPNDAGDFIPFHGFIYRETTGLEDMGTFTTAWPQYQNGYSIAYDINEANVAVGLAGDQDFAFKPFVWDDLGGMAPLPVNPAYSAGEWYAVALNDAGLIAGHVIAATNQSLPHYWPDRDTAPIQISMPLDYPYGEIYAVNDSDTMVGIMWSEDTDDAVEHAFIYDPTNGVRDLNDLIDSASGWLLTFAKDINDAGQIVGTGELNGVKRGFVMTPFMGLLVDITGQGTVTKDPDATVYAAGTSVALIAVPEPGWNFSHWTGPVDDVDSARTAVTINADTTVTAVFTAVVNNFALTVQTDGQGSVSRLPDAASYTAGTVVQLNAVPEPGWNFSHWTGPVDDVDSVQTAVTINADTTVRCVFVSDGDSDGDGVPDVNEQGPNGTDPDYDGNGDQIPDVGQTNVTSIFSADGTQYVTLEVAPGRRLVNVTAVDTAGMSDLPADISFDWGFFRFTIADVPVNGDAEVRLFLPADARPDTFYKFGPTADDIIDHWYDYSYDGISGLGAEIDANVVTLHFQDGALGDDDLNANGEITDDGGPAAAAVTAGNQSSATDGDAGDSGGSSGSSGCFVRTIRP
jgi:hypothetical protein